VLLAAVVALSSLLLISRGSASDQATGRTGVSGPGATSLTTSSTTPGHLHPHPGTQPLRLLKDLSIYPELSSTTSWESLVGLAHRAGAAIISTDINWASVQPNGPGVPPDLSTFGTFVTFVRRLGMQVRLQLTGFPSWARDPGAPSSAAAPWVPPTSVAELARWSQFASGVARRFKGEVSYYEIWNEPNISPFWEPFPDPAQYASLLEASYVAIKGVDARPQVMFGGLSRNDVGFLQQTYAAVDRLFPATAARDHHFFDVLGADPYAGDRSPAVDSGAYDYQDGFGLMDQNFGGFSLLHQVMQQHGEGDKRLYIAEYGLSTLGWNGYPPVSDATRAAYLTEAFAIARNAGYVEAFSWFCLYPTPYDGADWALLQGTSPDWVPTLTFKAWKTSP
jgi:hypothetical protein